MKSLLILFSLIIFSISPIELFGQNDSSKCKVINEELQGIYKGDCNNGLADGKGSFSFANGLFLYKGHFKNGKMHGQGEMFEKKGKKLISIKKGIWNQNVYSKPSEQYTISQVLNIDRYTVRRIEDGNRVFINFLRNGAKNSITNLSVFTNNGVEINGSQILGYDVIEFPFKCEIVYTTKNKFNSTSYEARLNFIINESGVWEINLFN